MHSHLLDVRVPLGRYLFTAAGQLSTIVAGVDRASSIAALIRKR